MLLDYLYEVFLSGGWVLIPILIVGSFGFFLAGLMFFELGHNWTGMRQKRLEQQAINFLKEKKERELHELIGKNNEQKWPMGDFIRLIFSNKDLGKEVVEDALEEKLKKGILVLDRHLPLIGVLAAVAPLLGLLGTVTGMVHTFQIITEFGNSNPMLMADGISEALITTQSGLLVAFPLVLIKHHLEDKIQWIKKHAELVITECLNHQYPQSAG